MKVTLLKPVTIASKAIAVGETVDVKTTTAEWLERVGAVEKNGAATSTNLSDKPRNRKNQANT